MNANITIELNGKTLNLPVEWQDIQVEATFVNETQGGEITGSQQANITFEKFTFVNQAAKEIRDYIAAGLTGGEGIFAGPTFKMSAFDAFNNLVVFNGMLDLTSDYLQVHTAKVECTIAQVDGLNNFADRVRGLSYGYLYDIGAITSSDFVNIQYVVERKSQGVELVLTGVTLFLLTKELIEAIKDLSKNISNVVAIATGGTPLTGLPASFALALAFTLIQAAYTALIIIAIIKIIQDLIARLLSPVRNHKGMLWRTMLEKACTHLGYKFVSPIAELDSVYFLPSKPDEDKPIQVGIPKPSDFGYIAEECFSLAMKAFNGKIAILNGNEVHLRSENDPFWKKTSTYQLPSLNVESIRYNTEDLRANRFVAFLTDVSDEWTTNNFKGTNYLVITTPKLVTDQKRVRITGLDQVQIQAALGNRKDTLTTLEILIKAVASTADGLINFFGANSNLAGLVNRKLGMLKVSSNVHSISKLLYLNSDRKLPANHRDLWSAKVLYQKYHNYKSFVANDFGGQYELYQDIKVPFGLDQFLALIQNRFFRNFDGRQAQADAIRWNISKDTAQMDYRVQQVYTKNLKETFVEPD